MVMRTPCLGLGWSGHPHVHPPQLRAPPSGTVANGLPRWTGGCGPTPPDDEPGPHRRAERISRASSRRSWHPRRVSTTWFTSDLHFGHKNIVRYCGRPFGDVDHMNLALSQAWWELIAPDDHVWVLGDVAMGVIAETLPLVERLPGHKHLIAGNHDRCWTGHGERSRDWLGRYEAVGFESIASAATIDLAGVEVLLSHFPYRGDSGPTERYLEHRPIDDGRWLLHGHVHDVWRQDGRQINVGVDAWDQRPVSEQEIAALIAAGERHLGPLASSVASDRDRPLGRTEATR